MAHVEHQASGAREYITFRIGAQYYCIDIMSVREIRGWTPATALPRAPAFVRGVINLRGVVLPIIDLADPGINLSEAKAALVYARLAKRLRALRLNAFRDYCDLVASPAGRAERQEMLTSLTTNVTKFFREPHHFEHMRAHVLTPFVEA